VKASKKLVIGVAAAVVAWPIGVRVVRRLRQEGLPEPLPGIGGWVAGAVTEALVFAVAVELGF
jgi:hypothetical protein